MRCSHERQIPILPSLQRVVARCDRDRGKELERGEERYEMGKETGDPSPRASHSLVVRSFGSCKLSWSQRIRNDKPDHAREEKVV